MGEIGEIFRGVLSYTHPSGSIMQNVLTWELQDSGESDAAVLAAIDTWVDDVWVPVWEDLASVSCALFLLEVDVINTDGTVARNVGEELHADLGTVIDEPLPSAVAGFIQFGTERAKSLGRKYVPGITESGSDDGKFTSTVLGNLLLLLGVTIVDIDVPIAGLLVAGVLSRVTDAFLENNGTGYVTDVPAYQRRRKVNVGS